MIIKLTKLEHPALKTQPQATATCSHRATATCSHRVTATCSQCRHQPACPWPLATGDTALVPSSQEHHTPPELEGVCFLAGRRPPQEHLLSPSQTLASAALSVGGAPTWLGASTQEWARVGFPTHCRLRAELWEPLCEPHRPPQVAGLPSGNKDHSHWGLLSPPTLPTVGTSLGVRRATAGGSWPVLLGLPADFPASPSRRDWALR